MAELQFGTEQGKLRGMCEMRGKVCYIIFLFDKLKEIIGAVLTPTSVFATTCSNAPQQLMLLYSPTTDSC
jgi:hypothetical protein